MATINYISGNINVSMFPTNANPIWFCDKNTGGINIATNGAAMTANTIQLGNVNTSTNVSGTLMTNRIISNTSTTLNIGDQTGGLLLGDKNVSGINIATNGAAFAANTINIGNSNSKINLSGNVGIGTTTPGYKLDVNGNARITSTLDVTGAITGSTVNGWTMGPYVLQGPNGGSWVLYQDSTNTYLKAPGNINFRPGSDDDKWVFTSSGNLYRAGSSSELSGINLPNNGAGINWGGGVSRIVDNGTLRICTDDNMIFQTGSNSGSLGTERIGISSGGNLGIGTVSPSYPLHVSGSAGKSGTGGHYFSSTAAFTSTPSPNGEVSIYTSNFVWSATGFVASSDRRIKNNIVDVQDDAALQLFRRIQPKTYEYVDKIKKGTETVYGFIAQEVREVLPIAATLVTETLPNLYTLVTVNGNILTIDPSKLEYDASGQLFPKLKLIKEDNSECFVRILSVTGNTVQIDTMLTEDKVFVYGQEVTNFHTLNKDAIWTVAAAALQEVDRQLQVEKEKTKTLEQNYEQLLQRILALESKGSA